MTPFGLLFVGYALFHDYWLDHGTNVRFLPYAIIALSFYTGLDVMFAGLAQALQNFRRAAYSTRWRTRFHADGGQCSSVMADSVPR